MEKHLVLILQLKFDYFFGMHVKQLNIVEQTCMFFFNHPNIHVPKTVNDYDKIPICFHIVHHESFEVWYGIYVFDHCFIELCPHHLLCFDVFKLHVANCTSHDFAICHIIYMANHYCLVSNMLDMVKHDLNFFQIFLSLHLCNHAHSTPNSSTDILEMETF